MDKSVHLSRNANSSRLQTEDVVKLVRPSDRIRAQVPVPTTYVGQALRLGQLDLLMLELFSGLLQIAKRDCLLHRQRGDPRQGDHFVKVRLAEQRAILLVINFEESDHFSV